VAPDQPIESHAKHPVLGPAIAVYDDRAKTKRTLIVEIALVPIGIMGVFLGNSDLSHANTLLGAAEIVVGIFLVVYGIRGAILDYRRLGHRIRLMIARDGFELYPGHGPVSWNDVADISDPRAPDGQPRTLRVQLNDRRSYAERHGLSVGARLMLALNRGDLILGTGMAMPVVDAERLMRKRLFEFQSPGAAPGEQPTPSPFPRTRRLTRKR